MRKVRCADSSKKKLHSIGSLEYLKCNKRNHIRVQDTDTNQSIICVEDMHFNIHGQSQFVDMYRIIVSQQSVRELLLL